MRYPTISEGGKYTLTTDNFSGGINLANTPERINDNQMRDSLNILFDGERYRTRDRIKPERTKESEWQYSIFTASLVLKEGEKINVEVKKTDAYITLDGVEENIFAVVVKADEYTRAITPIVMHDGSVTAYKQWESTNTTAKTKFFIAAYQKKLYLFVHEEYDGGSSSKVYSADGMAEEWKEVNSSDMYIPTVITNGLPSVNTVVEGASIQGDLLEGYNLLSGRYKAVFSDVDPNEENSTQRYLLPAEIPEEEGATYKVTKTASTGKQTEYKGQVVKGEDGDYYGKGNCSDTPKTGDRRAMWYKTTNKKSYILIQYYDGSAWEEDSLPRGFYARNNLEIEVPYSNADGIEKICDNVNAVYFGGGASGTRGGTRLFISGGDTESGIIRYSDLNNPLYFPENNYAYIGSSGTRITAMAKQSNMLVVFTANSSYYITYNEGGGTTATEVQDGSVVDITTTSAYFPIIPISPTIGCNCPGTLALCNDRLVWTNSYGKTYTLTSANQYSNCNIYELSVMVEKRLKEWGSKRISTAAAAAADGKYMLFCGNECLVMEYRSYGFIYIASYYRNRTGSRNIPWYYLNYPVEVKGAINDRTDEARILAVLTYTDEDDVTLVRAINYGFTADSDSDSVINSNERGGFTEPKPLPVTTEFSTKLFNMGKPMNKKTVGVCYLGIGHGCDSSELSVSFVTERGETAERVLQLTDGRSGSDTDYIKDLRILPAQPRVRKFGLCVHTETPITLDHIVIKYKLTGEVK